MKFIKIFIINLLCAAFFVTPAQAALLPTVMSLEDRLDSEVEKIITSGHLRPAYSMVTNLYYRNTSIVGSSVNSDVFEFDDLFHNPADLFYSLSIAFPHLSSSRQTEVLNYLATEFQSYSPVLYTHIGRSGNNREINPLPESVTLGSFNVSTASPANPSWTGWNFNPFSFLIS